MDRVLMIVGVIVAACGVILALKEGDKNKTFSALEWVLLIAGILIYVIGLNM